MRYTFIAAVSDLHCQESLQRGIQVARDLFLTNDPEVSAALLRSHDRDFLGLLETKELLLRGKSRAFVHATCDLPHTASTLEEMSDLLHRWINLLQWYLIGLWFTRDCSVSFDRCYLLFPHSPKAAVISESKSITFTHCDGLRRAQSVTKAELRDTRELLRSIAPPMEGVSPETVHSGHPTKASARTSRCLYFLQAARWNASIPDKIAAYCTCFESLTTTDSQEATHKVAERIAVLRKGAEDARKVLKDIKSAYRVRSKLVHGDSIDDPREVLVATARRCDQILRDLLVQISKSDELQQALGSKPALIEEFYSSLLFGAGLDGQQ